MKGLLICGALSILGAVAPRPCDETIKAPPKKPVVQMAILLDTSNSMDGLINQAKTQLWKIVNEFATAKQYGLTPELQVALYEYGKSTISGQEGFLRQVLPFTTDLDRVSEQLFSLTTNGGEEYCGKVIQAAADGLTWGSNNNLKVMFVCGNEPFTQGNTDYREACKNAVLKGIAVNTIHCGDYQQGISGMWQDGAVRGEGKFFCINQDLPVAVIHTPFDEKIANLNIQLNQTYIAFGTKGKEGLARQEAQDRNANGYSAGTLAERAQAKASPNYSNSTWDLVDACKEKTVKVETLTPAELPEELKKLDADARVRYVQTKVEERSKIQIEIKKLGEERARYVAEKQKDLSKNGNSLDEALIQAIRELAMKKNFDFKK